VIKQEIYDRGKEDEDSFDLRLGVLGVLLGRFDSRVHVFESLLSLLAQRLDTRHQTQIEEVDMRASEAMRLGYL
jgi:hypothetical protein